MIDHVLGRPSVSFRKTQVLAVVSFWSFYLLQGHRHGPPVLRNLSKLWSKRLTAWQTLVVTLLWLYISRNFGKIVGLESPEPLANLYNRAYFRATWVTTALDAGFWTAMRIRKKWLRDLASMVFTLYYLIAAEQADEKVRKVRGMLTLEHLRVAWNKPTTPYLKFISNLMRPRLMQYPPRKILIPRPQNSVYKEPVTAWLYFDGPLSAIGAHTKVVLDVPGGGFVAMDPRTHDDKLIAWAAKTGLAVLSLDYRKAPEFPFPFALDECFDVYHTIISTRGRCIGLESGQMPRIIVTGDSAGGNLATGLVLKVLMTGQTDTNRWQAEDTLPPPEGLILVYPGLDMNIGSWMTDEQMALIYDRRTRRTNKNILRRKSEDLYNLDPQTPHAFDDDSAPTEGSGSNEHEHSPRMTFETVHGSSPELSRAISNSIPLPISTSEPGMPAQALSPDSSYVPSRSPLQSQSSNVASSKPQVLKTRLATSSLISYFADRILTPEMMRAMIILYVGPYNRPDFSTDFLLCPLHAPEALLARFPKTYFLTGERDPLVDDTVIMAGRIRQAKSNLFVARKELGLIKDKKEFDETEHVEVMLIPGISHGFFQFVSIFPEGWKHIFRCARWMEEIFEANDGMLETPSETRPQGEDSLSPFFATTNGNGDLQERHHQRVPTAGSSGDDDQPLMMTRIKPASNGSGNGSVHSVGAEQDTNGIEKRERTNGLKPKRPLAGRRMKSLVTLASEEDLLGRRMEGLAGSLMGTGDEGRVGWRTP